MGSHSLCFTMHHAQNTSFYDSASFKFSFLFIFALLRAIKALFGQWVAAGDAVGMVPR